MKDLGITQKFLLLALNKNGKLSAWASEQQVCLTGGAVLELLEEGCCRIEGKKVTAVKEPDKSAAYLTSVYRYLEEKPRKLDKITYDYTFTFTDARLKKLLSEVGESLAEEGCVRKESKGLIVENIRYYPEESCVDNVVQQLRAELLEEGEVSEDMVVLAALLDVSGLLKQYFSKYETEQLKSRLKSIRESEQGATVRKMLEYMESIIVAVIAVVN